MPTFIITTIATVSRHYRIEAEDEAHAREIVLDGADHCDEDLIDEYIETLVEPQEVEVGLRTLLGKSA